MESSIAFSKDISSGSSNANVIDFSEVTELAGDEVSREQIQRLCNRYYWAATFCEGKDVVEVACGSGQGLAFLKSRARSLEAGDSCEPILSLARQHYADTIPLSVFDAQKLPFADASKDLIILFEALYYIPSAKQFAQECRRVLRQDGKVLIATANKDLFDFNPSPHTHSYYGVVELGALFREHGFTVECFGDTPVGNVSFRQKLLRPVKKLAVDLHLIPSSMKYKKWLKRVVFGGLERMPIEIDATTADYQEPTRLSVDTPDRQHKVIYAVATLTATRH